jgi:hypothetical protein
MGVMIVPFLRGDALRLAINDDGRDMLRAWQGENPEEWDSESNMRELFRACPIYLEGEELQECSSSDTGDLTSAPMLAILSPSLQHFGESEWVGFPARHVGRLRVYGEPFRVYRPIIAYWAFMAYAVRSPLADMLECGYSDWQAGHVRDGVPVGESFGHAMREDARRRAIDDRLDLMNRIHGRGTVLRVDHVANGHGGTVLRRVPLSGSAGFTEWRRWNLRGDTVRFLGRQSDIRRGMRGG